MPTNQTDYKAAELRAKLEIEHGEVYSTEELRDKFEVESFAYGLVFVTRKADGVKGTMDFTHMSRFYFRFVAN